MQSYNLQEQQNIKRFVITAALNKKQTVRQITENLIAECEKVEITLFKNFISLPA